MSYQANTQAQKLNDMNYGTDFSAVTRVASAGNAPVYSATGVPSAGTCVAAPTRPPRRPAWWSRTTMSRSSPWATA